MIIINNDKKYHYNKNFFKNPHHYWFDSFRWLIELEKYSKELLGDRNAGDFPASPDF